MRDGGGNGSGSAAAQARLERELGLVRDQLNQAEAQRRELLASTSWKVTAPLRWLRGLLQRPLAAAAAAGDPGMPPFASGKRLNGLPEHLRTDVDLERLYTGNQVFRALELERAMEGVVPPELAVDDVQARGSEWYFGDGEPLARIGFVGSRELGEELAFDAVVHVLRVEGWQRQLEACRLDFLLIETAWDPEGGWRYGLVGTGEEAAELSRMLEEVARIGVPVALWVREAADEIGRFGWLLPRVQAVYAADHDAADRLASLAPEQPVKLLLPAVQPRMHHPVRSDDLREALPAFADKVLFDGWWDLAGVAGSSARLQQLATSRLVVVDSRWHVGGVRLQDLPDYRGAMLGCVTPMEKAALSRLLPVEYLVDSPLLPAWRRTERALRAAACGSVVVSEPEIAHGALSTVASIQTGGGDPYARIEGLLADPLARMRTAHLGLREILSTHRVADRLRTIMRDLGLALPLEPDARVAVVLVSMRPELVVDCLASYRAQDYPQRELIVVVHGDGDASGIRAKLREGEQLLQLGRERSLGDCLNFAMMHTDAPYWAKIDDDDHYGPAYLSDLMRYRHTVPAWVWGKPPMFLHSQAHDELGWDPVWAQHANLLHRSGRASSALVAGGTLAGRREVFDTVRFPSARRGGSDSEFIRQCYSEGFDVLSTDGFNFVRFRSAKTGFHTWQAPTAELRDRTEKKGTGADVTRLAFV